MLFLLLPVGVALQRVADPWPVADPASAAEFVQAHRSPDEPVIGNDWTHLYYFRRLGAEFHPVGKVPVCDAERVWVVWTGTIAPEQRLSAAAIMVPADWRVVERYDSLYTTTVLFAKPPYPPSRDTLYVAACGLAIAAANSWLQE